MKHGLSMMGSPSAGNLGDSPGGISTGFGGAPPSGTLGQEPPESQAASGSAYVQQERAWAKAELEKDPALKRFIGGVISHEEAGERRGNVFESMVNRVNYLRAHGQPNLTLRSYLSRTGDRQFYGPLRRGEINERYLKSVDMPGAMKSIDAVLGGRDVIGGLTDQGSRGDPNYNKSVYIDPKSGEGYGDLFGPKGRAYREERQRKIKAADDAAKLSDDRKDVDRGTVKTVNVNSAGTVQVDVGTTKNDATLGGDGLFRQTGTERKTQMTPASTGPKIESPKKSESHAEEANPG